MNNPYKNQAISYLMPLYHKGVKRNLAKGVRLYDSRPLSSNIITSEATFKKYVICLSAFLEYCANNSLILDFEDKEAVKNIASKYLIEKSNSVKVPTLKTYRSAISKAFRINDGASIIELPVFCVEDITRERGEVPEKVIKAREINKELVTFVKATGLRMRGTRAIEKANVMEYAGHTYIVVREKGGRIRACPIIADDVDINVINRMIFEANDNKIIKKIPKNLWMHDLRARFAGRLYCLLERNLEKLPRQQLYIRKNGTIYDRFALSTVAIALGHGGHRIEDMVRSYSHRIPEEWAELERLDQTELAKLKEMAREYETGLREINKHGLAVKYFTDNIWGRKIG